LLPSSFAPAVAAFDVRAVVSLGGPLEVQQLEPLLRAGLDSVWLRAHASEASLLAEAEVWSEALRLRGVRCIRSLAVWRAGCGDGLHLRAVEQAPEGALVLSTPVHCPTELAAARRRGALSALVSPVFTPFSKAHAVAPMGIEGLRQIAAEASMPCIALGGVSARRLHDCEEAGAAGAALLGSLLTEEGRSELLRWLEQRAVRLPSS